MTTIKITELANIGPDLASSSLVPVVNMAGTPVTQKTNIGNIANLVLQGAGVDYPEATVALLAQTVSNAAQPNITSVGTLTNVAVSGNASINGNITSNGTAYLGNISTTGEASITTLIVGSSSDLGSVNNIKIEGGVNGQVLSTDGDGNLSWVAQSGGGGNGSPGGSNTQVQYNDAGDFGGDADFTYDAGNNILNVIRANVSYLTAYNSIIGDSLTVEQDVSGNGALRLQGIAGGNSTINIGGEADIDVVANVGNINLYTANNQPWVFDQDGNLTLPNDANIAIYGNTTQFNTCPNGFLGLNSYDAGGNNIARVSISSTDGLVAIGVSNPDTEIDYNWTFANGGGTIFPTLDTQRGDNPSGTITGQTLLFGDSTQEAIISTPDGTTGNEYSQRLVINPGAGNNYGEGGDIYLWAGRGGNGSGSGGDIKIRGGQGGANTSGGNGGDGGYIRIEAGDAQVNGVAGYIDITGGQGGAGQGGGYVHITGGYGYTLGGEAKISGGYGQATGGNVDIWGGASGNGQSNEGRVNIQTGGKTWTYDASGNLTLPGNTFAVNYANGTQVSLGGSSYSNANVANYLPTFTGGNIGSAAGGQGVTNLNLSGNIVATPQLMSINWSAYHMDFSQYGRVNLNTDFFANANVIGAQYLKGDGSNVANVNAIKITNGTSNINFSGTNGNAIITTNTSNQWKFDTNGKLTLPQLTTINDVSGTGATVTVGVPPTVIVISGADFVAVNNTYTRDFGEATPTWYPAGYTPGVSSYIMFTGGQYGIYNPGFVPPLYVNAGTLNIPLTQWNLNPPLGSVAPTAVYTYGVTGPTWNFNSNGSLIVPTPGNNEATFQSYGNGPGEGSFVKMVTSASSNFVIGTGGNNHFVINTNKNGANARWIFDDIGNLTLPNGGSLYSMNSTPSGNPGNTIILQPAGANFTTNQKLMVYPTAADGDHIHMTSGNLYETELFLGSDNLYVKLANTGNVVINSNDSNGNSAMWTFDTTGNLTLPGNLVINGLTNVFGSNVALLESNPDLPLLSISSGSNGGASSLWAEDIGNIGTSNIAAVYTNPTPGSGIVRIAVGQNGGNSGPNLWDFNANGTTTFPGGLIGSGASPAPYISGFDSISSISVSASGNISANNFTGNGGGLSNVATQTTGNWTLAPGVNTVSINVPLNGTYSIWVRGNIPNGIVTYTATAVVTNTNVPVLGTSYGWYYAAGNALVLTSIPTQFVGTLNNISNAVVSTTTANVFTFGITNNSGSNAVVNYGYTKL